jgi:hypothetical protein
MDELGDLTIPNNPFEFFYHKRSNEHCSLAVEVE